MPKGGRGKTASGYPRGSIGELVHNGTKGFRRETIQLAMRQDDGSVIRVPVDASVKDGVAVHIEPGGGTREYSVTDVQTGLRWASFRYKNAALNVATGVARTLNPTRMNRDADGIPQISSEQRVVLSNLIPLGPALSR